MVQIDKESWIFGHTSGFLGKQFRGSSPGFWFDRYGAEPRKVCKDLFFIPVPLIGNQVWDPNVSLAKM